MALLVVAVLAPVAVYAAGGTFTDDDTSIFEADIEWLAGAGVTLGCNPPTNDNYCPNDSVTRGQMAAFMHRLADNQVVDAGGLAGETPSYYLSALYANDVTSAGLTLKAVDATNQTMAEIMFDVPAVGFLLINTSVSIVDTDSQEQTLWWLQVDDTVCKNVPASTTQVAFGYVTSPATGGRQGLSLSGAAAVTAGSHTVTLCGRGAADNTQAYEPSLTALFTTAGEILAP
jgi:hypothetical protein